MGGFGGAEIIINYAAGPVFLTNLMKYEPRRHHRIPNSSHINLQSVLLSIPPLTMSDPTIQVSETIQAASVKQNPSPSRDINPPTSTSGKHLAVETSPDDAHSIPSDIVDPNRMIKPVTRRHNLPPLPDLRFEQSYLASLKGAESWGRIAWITIRDQVCSTTLHSSLDKTICCLQ